MQEKDMFFPYMRISLKGKPEGVSAAIVKRIRTYGFVNAEAIGYIALDVFMEAFNIAQDDLEFDIEYKKTMMERESFGHNSSFQFNFFIRAVPFD